MRSAWLLCVLAAPLRAQAPQRCFVEVDVPPGVIVEQPAIIDVTIGWDRAWFSEHAVALVRRPVDAPLHLELPWLGSSSASLVSVMPVADGLEAETIVVEDRLHSALVLEDELRDGASFHRLRLRCRWLPLTAGVQPLMPARLRYAFATEFRDHILRGREPVDRREASVMGDARSLEVRAMPGDAPIGYTGAVGSFEVKLYSGGEEVPVGGSFEVSMEVWGDARTNLERFAKPNFLGLDGFHVQGVIEAPSQRGRRFVASLVALREGETSVDGLSLIAYEPAAEAYVRLGGESLPVRVVARRDDVALPEGIEELIRRDELARSSGVWRLRWLFVALAVAVLLLLRFARRPALRAQLDLVLVDLRAALSVMDAARSAAAFESFLACFSGVKAFEAPSIWEVLRRRGVAPDGVVQLRALHAAFDQARFGGPLPDAGEVFAAVDTLIDAVKR